MQKTQKHHYDLWPDVSLPSSNKLSINKYYHLPESSSSSSLSAFLAAAPFLTGAALAGVAFFTALGGAACDIKTQNSLKISLEIPEMLRMYPDIQ